MNKYLITWREPKKLPDRSELVKETIEANGIWNHGGMYAFYRTKKGRSKAFHWVAIDLIAEMKIIEETEND